MPLMREEGLKGRRQAIEFLLGDLHLSLKSEVVEWFSYVKVHFSESELNKNAMELVNKQVSKNFSRKASWHGDLEYIAVPYYKLITSGYPYFTFTIDFYLAAMIRVGWGLKHLDYLEDCFITEPIKKGIEKFNLPLEFLEGISKGDLSHFEQRERDNKGYFTWYVPSLGQEIRLHSFFLNCLEKAFRGKPLGPSLMLYRLTSLWEGILVERSLLLKVPPQTFRGPLKTSWSEGNVLSALESLGIPKKQGKEKTSYLKTISPQPSSDEEAITIVLKSL